SAAEIDLAFAELGRNPSSGLIAASDIFIVGAREAILKSAEAHRVPVISPYRQFVIEGSLMSYGPDNADIFRRSSSYVDRILKGESPANLPVQSPSKFEFVFNLKTAKALGLSVRSSILQLADEVIEYLAEKRTSGPCHPCPLLGVVRPAVWMHEKNQTLDSVFASQKVALGSAWEQQRGFAAALVGRLGRVHAHAKRRD